MGCENRKLFFREPLEPPPETHRPTRISQDYNNVLLRRAHTGRYQGNVSSSSVFVHQFCRGGQRSGLGPADCQEALIRTLTYESLNNFGVLSCQGAGNRSLFPCVSGGQE